MTGNSPPGGQKAQAPVILPHFRVGTYEAEVNDMDSTITMTTAAVAFPAYNPKPTDWLPGIWFLIECVTSGNSANVAFKEDGPFSAIDHVTFQDVGSILIAA